MTFINIDESSKSGIKSVTEGLLSFGKAVDSFSIPAKLLKKCESEDNREEMVPFKFMGDFAFIPYGVGTVFICHREIE